MNQAIAILTATAETAENNAPIHEREGNLEQAQLCRETARDCREAIEVLDGD